MTGFLRGESFVPLRRTQNNSNHGFRAIAKFPRTEPQANLPGVSRRLFRICRRKKVGNLLLLSKRKRVIIPVGNLKVDSP
jgi:hypothetical protein